MQLLGAELLLETLVQFEKGEQTRMPQDDARASYAPRIEKSEAQIDWNKDAETILRETRAFVPWPVSFTSLDNKTVRVWRAEIDTSRHHDIPGRIIEHDRTGLYVS